MVRKRKTQYGGIQFPVYRGVRQQRGHGIGGLFRGLFRTVAPMLKKGLTHVGKRALTAGANALSDISENNTPIKEALKKQVKSELNSLNPINMMQSMNAVSSKKTRKRAATPKKRKAKRKKVNKFAKVTI